MSVILRPLKWFYHEFGIVSIHETGRNAWLIILARSCRMFAYGTNSLILAIFFSALNYSDHQIGIFMTLTLLGDVFLGTFLTLIADRVGRRRVLMAGSVLMILSGCVFAVFENFWILLGAAILGVISVTGGDFGPFRSIEESVLSQLTTPSNRADVLAWYVTTSTLGSSIGSETSGRIIHFLQARPGWTEVEAYHALFWIYAVMGIVNVLLVVLLTEACELKPDGKGDEVYASVPQEDRDEESEHDVEHSRPNGIGVNDIEAATRATSSSTTPALQYQSHSHSHPPTPSSERWTSRTKSWLSSVFAEISKPTRRTMYKLWFLLAIDSLADGMVPYSLTNYYMDIKFHPTKSTLGDVTSLSYFLGAVGAVFAGPLARKIGLINTMVFTHVPSSAAVLFFPFPPYLWLTAGLLLLRTALNNMDQAPRSAFIAAVVRPEERTAVMGITSMLRNLAAMTGPSVTGVLAEGDRFGVAFVAAGVCRLVYDFGLYALFVNVQLEGYERKPKNNSGSDEEIVERERTPRLANGVVVPVSARGHGHDEVVELASLADSEDSEQDHQHSREDIDKRGNGNINNHAKHADAKEADSTITMTNRVALQVPSSDDAGLDRVRSRSPHRSTALD
ncbi:uncharacterized protein Z519_10352 [Cladophialophora bantiana CBS 173.52]|uniref:Major facilitator superfamily (MFS) profile domain-containing protein n=1 Tax=Cladophialophora bantiana (strain ATCC 10958 / CBS 173.52 / CDC B-1940 / NIH 8579) TaxID=1442370 RepID=A0A0D2H6C1_CLAB1|nr:uncharacterized protein Z519_10352 [Cladophialophora bantiana CBS 173.52]KIW88868.1 hypothetical protein Z519_10352 [Cladophialophora bantiana CBS 173.52]